MSRPVVLAIDGPAGAGKSTVAERLAHDLGYFYFDTGVLYRAVALRCLEDGTDLADEAALARLVAGVTIQVRPPSVADGRQLDVSLEGRDVSLQIRSPQVDAVVSRVAASPAVRAGLIDLQRQQIQGAGTIMAGRDIGTVVCPDADLKIYLTASPGERAQRRLTQVGGAPEQLEATQQAIEERDRLDSSRAISPLVAAPDAIEIDSDGKSIDEVVQAVRDLLERRISERSAAGADR
ncbi:MAG: (d)CMP kinase [Chloroflexota bacterium]